MHHPLTAAAVVWLIVLAVIVRLHIDTIVLGLAPTVAVVIAYILSKRTARDAAAKVAEVHGLVNSQKQELERKIADLETQLAAKL